MPPCRSASVTTPTGSESQARMRLHRDRNAGEARRPVEPGDLRRAAADVEDDDRLRLRIGQRRAAGDGEIGLGPPVDDLEVEAEFRAHPIDEGGAVRGEAAGFRGDETRADDALRRHLVAADPQRLQGALDRPFAEAVAVPEPLAEADDP